MNGDRGAAAGERYGPRRRDWRACLALATAAVVLVPWARANDVYTSTNTTGFWSDSGQWVSNVVPLSGIDTELDFGGSGAGANTFTDDIGSGTFTLNEIQLNSSASASQTIAGNASGNTLTFAGNSLSAGPQVVQNGSGAFTISNGLVLQNTLTFGGSGAGAVSLAGPISGPGGLTLNGPYTLTLGSATSTFTGDITINAGTLEAAATYTSTLPAFSALGSRAAAGRMITVNAGGQLLFSASNVLGQYETPVPAFMLTINPGGTVAAGPGTFNMLGAITLNGGTLAANAGGSSFYLKGLITVGGTVPSAITTAAGAANTGVLLAPSATIFNVADVTGDARADLSISAPLLNAPSGGGLGALTKNGPGTLLLTSASTYTGLTTINAGTLDLNDATGSLPSTADLTFTGGGTFVYENAGASSNHSQKLNNITFAGGDATLELDSTRSPGNSVVLIPLGVIARTTGGTGNIVFNGPSANTVLEPAGMPGREINQGTFFNGSDYAWIDGSTALVGPVPYGGSDATAVTFGGSTSGVSGTFVQTTGPVSGQTTATFRTLNIAGNYNFLLASGATLTVNGILKSGNVAGGATLGDGGTAAGAIQAATDAELVIRTDGPNDSLTINTRILANGTNALTKSGLGTLTLSGTNTYTGLTTVNAGTLAFASDRNSFGGGGLVVGGTAGVAQVNDASSGTLTFNLPDVGGISGSLTSSNAAGAINQSNGTFNYSNASVGYLQLGTGLQSAGSIGGYGAYTLTGGLLNSGGAAAGIRVGSVGLGSFTQSGGTVIVGRDFSVGTWGTGVATLTGGTLLGATGFGISIGDVSGSGTLNLGTLAGGAPSMQAESAAGVQLAGGAGSAGVLNLNGGTLYLTAGTIHKGAGASAVLNWNGGTVAAGAAGLTLVDGSLDQVNVFSGGAIVDTESFTATLAAPLAGTAGNGIYPANGTLGIALPAGSGYIGAPLVSVGGGSGSGATAIATLANGSITGVTLTSPGQNYHAGDVLNFTFSGGGAATAATPFSYTLQVPDLSLNSVGGLTKLGSGTLILSASNTFLGRTNIASGTLQVDGSLGNTPVAVAPGATLAGKGTIGNTGANAVTVSGTIAPGDVATDATLTTGPMIWDAGGSYTVKVSQLPGGTPSAGAGTNWDNLSVTNLTVAAGNTPGTQFTIALVGNPPGFAPTRDYAWQIAQVAPAGAVSGFDPSKFVLDVSRFAGGSATPSAFSLQSDGSMVDVVYSPAPEPSSLWLLGTLGGAGGLLVRRRRPRARVRPGGSFRGP